MSGGVSELGGMKIIKKKKEWFNFMAGLCLAILIIFSVCNIFLLSEINNSNDSSIAFSTMTNLWNNTQKDLNVFKQDLNILKNNDVILSKNQISIINSLVLNDLGASGCQITSQTQIDVNFFAVSLVCPVKEVK